MNTSVKIICLLVAILFIGAIIFFGCTPTGKRILLGYDSSMKEVGEVSYETRKKVEDTCRSMIANYQSDIDIYNMYKDSDNPNQKNYADAALVRAIRTANEYNEYILKNSFVWGENVPKDIYMSLETNIK